MLQQIVTLAKLRRPPVTIRVPIMTESADRHVDLTSNEYSSRARLVPNQYKFKISNPVQEKPTNDGVGAIPATLPKTCNVPAPDTIISGSVKAAPEIFEIDD
jgi:hypothetical protein